MKKVFHLPFPFLRMSLIFAFSMKFSFATDTATIEAGRRRAQICVACHGEGGLSTNPLWPHLRGQQEDYLILQLKKYRSYERLHPLMNPISQTLTDEDIAQLAAYYSSLKCDDKEDR